MKFNVECTKTLSYSFLTDLFQKCLFYCLLTISHLDLASIYYLITVICWTLNIKHTFAFLTPSILILNILVLLIFLVYSSV